MVPAEEATDETGDAYGVKLDLIETGEDRGKEPKFEPGDDNEEH